MPATLWVAAGIAAGVALAERFAWVAEQTARIGSTLAWSAFALAACAAAAWLLRRRWPAATLALCGLVAGAAIGGAFWLHLGVVSTALEDSRQGSWSGCVVSDPTVGAFGSSSLLEVRLADGSAAEVRAQWPKGVAPELGREVEAFGSIVASQSPDAKAAAFTQGVGASLRVRRLRSVAWGRGLRGVLGRMRAWESARVDAVAGRGGALLGSTLLGQRWRVAGGSLDRDMRIAGLAHFEATSGYHVMLLAGLVEWALVATQLGRRSRSVASVVVVGAFVLLTGGRVSAVRSWGMGATAGVAHSAGRRGNGLSALALTASLFLCLAPSALFDLGFQMSVLGIGGILLFARLTEGWLAVALPRPTRGMAAPIALTLCAVMATLPLTATAFGVVSLVAPLANLLALPLVVLEFVVGVAGMGVAAVWGFAGTVLLGVAASFAAMLGDLAAWMASLPHAAIPVEPPGWLAIAGGCGAAVAMWAWWPQPRRGVARAAALCALVATIPLAFGAPVAGGASITVMDIGQGDAILIRDGADSMLVDTGPDGGHVLPALARLGVRSLDGVVITHLHADHYGGLSAVASVVKIPVVFFPAGALKSALGVIGEARRDASGHVEELVDGDRLKVGAIELDVVSPAQPVQNAATNEASVVMVARDASQSVLLTGDAESGVLEQVEQRGELPAVDVLKVGHHGSAISMSPGVLAVLRPGAAVISVGAGNRYGHPTPTALRLLAERSIPTYRTDLDGDVTMTFGPAGVRVTTSKRVAGAGRQPTDTRWAKPLGSAEGVYAKLGGDKPPGRSRPLQHDSTEPDVSLACRPQQRLPHLRDRGPPPRPGAGAAPEARGRGRGPRLQLRLVRG